MSIEQEEGDKKTWKAVGGDVIDTIASAPTLRIKFHVKNLNKSVMEKVFDVKENVNTLEVNSLVSTKEFALTIIPEVIGAEIFKAPRVKLSGTISLSEDAGYGVEMTATILKAKADKPLFYLEKKA